MIIDALTLSTFDPAGRLKTFMFESKWYSIADLDTRPAIDDISRVGEWLENIEHNKYVLLMMNNGHLNPKYPNGLHIIVGISFYDYERASEYMLRFKL